MHRSRNIALVAAAALTAAWCGNARAADAPVAGTLDTALLAGLGSLAGGTDELVLGGPGAARAGTSVAFLGDVNGDGEQDYGVGGPLASGGGRVAVVFGPVRPGIALDVIALGDRGFRIRGEHVNALAGASVTGVGDVNGDELDDVLVGAPGTAFTDRGKAGAAYVVFGRRDTTDVRLRTLGAGGVRLAGAAAGDRTGGSVASVPDLDGDGRRDLVIGADSAGANVARPHAGATYVVYSAGLAQSTIDLAQLGSRGYRIDGAAAEDRSGYSVSSVGDMNADGRPEIVIGAPNAGGTGAAYVVWGKPPPAASGIDLSQLGTQGFASAGGPGDRAGWSVAGLADATGDGVPDVAVGAPGTDANGRPGSGTVYVAAGKGDAAPTLLGTTGFRVDGGGSADRTGTAVAGAGDVDADGRADVLVGVGRESALTRPRSGSALLVLSGRVAGPSLDAALLGYSGLRLAGLNRLGETGYAVAGGVDVDGDGRPDMLVGHRRSHESHGSASLVTTPAPAGMPATPARLGTIVATNVEVVVDDSSGMRDDDPAGVMRRQAIEQLVVNPVNGGRVFGAVEFGSRAHQIIPPTLAADLNLVGLRLDVFRLLLAERIADNAGVTNVDLGLAAADAANPGAQARIFLTDGDRTGALAPFRRRTDVIALGGAVSSRLTELARASGGDYYPVSDGGALQSTVAAIDAQLRGEESLASSVTPTAGALPVNAEAPGEVAVKVQRPDATVAFAAATTASQARTMRSARMVVTWNKRRSRFRLTGLRLRLPEGSVVRVARRDLTRALHRKRGVRLKGGVNIRGRAGRTYIVLDVRGLHRRRGGTRAVMASGGYRAYTRLTRTAGGRNWVVPRSQWTYQRRPTR